MRRAARAAQAALVVAAGAAGVAAASSPARAQEYRPRIARAAQAPPDPSARRPDGSIAGSGWSPAYGGQPLPSTVRPHHRAQRGAPAAVYYYPVPNGYPYYPYGSYGGGVTDATGRPLYIPESADPPANRYEYPSGTPDLSGSPFAVVDGGAMLVDFGNGDRRTVPSCARLAAERTPDGQSRTIFYTPLADGLVLRAGARGRVLGAPPAGARTCYEADAYGRVVLAY